ncbi:hypothetical protein EMIHUDRAFT_349998 [Emiliania huxleyi CCMP1516]|jgi:hypothetical protein|uniref:Uncharacterized protein n=2 Tax=Emiliania huxleyi TaxID=2903 RepID=A0A0D3J4A6_EMIH1|nr:hypothetical protein EMIHUDRAFT_349998 [Emiliania huxleyi CCMP1516]EOD18341.1 hypothetical protein EMIHUDRAFT_349998 [Emiliania huxleyi CCMP1516]|eukprot:XP_005770770.1 hypothetical protein EMIHUDRAFT_349998 [Emiliania huxleyi CCMP1516]
MEAVIESLLAFARSAIPTGAESAVQAVQAVLSSVTTDARGAYPLPLCWGNALWAVLACRKHFRAQPAHRRPGVIFSLLATFVLFTMPANLAANWLIFGRTPSALTHPTILPTHLACYAAVLFFPFSLLERVLGSALPYALLDTLGVLDNATTAFNYLEEAYVVSGGSAVLAIAAAMAVNLGGGMARHFAFNGFSDGAASFDSALGVAVLYSAAASFAYFHYAVEPCAALLAEGAAPRLISCVGESGLYERLAWLAAARNLYSHLPSNQYAHGTSFVRAEMEGKAKAKAL